jgi:hypothetical protein
LQHCVHDSSRRFGSSLFISGSRLAASHKSTRNANGQNIENKGVIGLYRVRSVSAEAARVGDDTWFQAKQSTFAQAKISGSAIRDFRAQRTPGCSEQAAPLMNVLSFGNRGVVR